MTTQRAPIEALIVSGSAQNGAPIIGSQLDRSGAVMQLSLASEKIGWGVIMVDRIWAVMTGRTLLAGLSLIAATASAQATDYAITMIDVPGSYGTTIVGINNLGQVAGIYNRGLFGPVSSFIWTAGTFSYFDVPDSYFQIPSNVISTTISNSTQISGINDNGDLVGQYYNLFYVTPFVYSNGTITTIGGPGIVPTDINNAGQITGLIYDSSSVQGFIDTAGTITPYAVPGQNSGYFEFHPTAINNAGTVSGYIEDSSGGAGFFYNSSGFHIVNYPDPNTIYTQLGGLNDLGQTVGGAVIESSFFDTTSTFFLYDAGTFETLNLPFGPDAINDSGVIVGTGYTTHNVGFIATPIAVTEPGSVALMIGFSAALALQRRRRSGCGGTTPSHSRA